MNQGQLHDYELEAPETTTRAKLGLIHVSYNNSGDSMKKRRKQVSVGLKYMSIHI